MKLQQILTKTSLLALIFILLTGTMALAGDEPAKGEQGKKETSEKMTGPVYVLMKTNYGDIELELDAEKAPITVANFLDYADDGFYNGTIFHRVIKTFMIQGGGFEPDMKKKPTNPPIKNEWKNGLKNVRGSIAMARRGGQANSATSQFFINVVDNRTLDMPQDGSGYAVFGQVVNGMDVVDKIKNVETTVVNGRRDVPKEPVIIEKVVRIDKPSNEK